jgi:twitching motility protein PilT
LRLRKKPHFILRGTSVGSVQTDDFLKSLLVTRGISDIHFKVARPPLIRVNGQLRPLNLPAMSQKDTEFLASNILGPAVWEKFQNLSEYDTSYAVAGFSRFRVSVFRQRGSISLVLRVVPFNVPTLDELRIPPVVKDIAMAERGLILVTGATGTGKSSTLAGMIEHINTLRDCHVITVEDPIEFLHRDKRASINQREIGVDTNNFNDAFRAALRQDPDIILVGELRDQETISTALRAAETGHLVLSTVHTTDAKETIGRFIDAFPPHQQRQVRLQLAANLRAVISQRLLGRSDGHGLVVAVEIMLMTAAIRECVEDDAKTSEVTQLMEKGREQYGMQTFDQALHDLLREKLISVDEAVRNATSPNDFKLKLNLM